VYSWLKHEVARDRLAKEGLGANRMPKVEKGTQDGQAWHVKAEPGAL
jgi:hypothetical protein